MKKKNQLPEVSVVPVNLNNLGDVSQLFDSELKIKLEQEEYRTQTKYLASRNYIHRKIADSNVLISVGSNIANFNGYIEINSSAADLWEKLQTPCQIDELEQVLEEKYGITHENAVEDVLDFLKVLQKYDMVVME